MNSKREDGGRENSRRLVGGRENTVVGGMLEEWRLVESMFEGEY
jgi:hypothetical protein